MKENWKGTVDLQTGEIGDDFAYYFTLSEQIPTAVSVGVLVNPDQSICASGGLIIQMMPDATEEDIVATETLLAQIKPMSQLVKETETLAEIIDSLYDDVEILSHQPIAFSCPCDKARMKRVLTTLSKAERMALIEEDHGCEITCNFCNERYQFSEAELRELEDFIDAHDRR